MNPAVTVTVKGGVVSDEAVAGAEASELGLRVTRLGGGVSVVGPLEQAYAFVKAFVRVGEEEYPSRLEALAAELYNVRAHSPQPMTPGRWERIKKRFPGTARVCMEDALEELDEP